MEEWQQMGFLPPVACESDYVELVYSLVTSNSGKQERAMMLANDVLRTNKIFSNLYINFKWF